MPAENVAMKVVGEVLTVTIDLSKKLRPSKTGKTVLVATSSGNIEVPGHPELRIGLNVYAKAA